MSGQGKFQFMDSENGGLEWLGLVTSHRRLFDAAQDGWLRPAHGAHGSCFLLGNESFVSEELPAGRNIIPIRLTFDLKELLFADVPEVLQREAQDKEDRLQVSIVRYSAPIPLCAVKSIEVSSAEHKSHLLAMAEQASNVSLPAPDIRIADVPEYPPTAAQPVSSGMQSVDLPECLNATQGAMAMSVWAVPRVKPWIEVMRRALSLDAEGVAEEALKLDAGWLQLPWLDRDVSSTDSGNVDEHRDLWRAAVHRMRSSQVEGKSPGAMAEIVAEAAQVDGKNPATETWLDQTLRIVAAKETVSCDNWQQNSAGLAIQLVLLRPEPMRFKSWSKDLPGLPPAIWWAAAMLCGWRHGFRALHREFRGDTTLQEFLTIRALVASWPSDARPLLHRSRDSALNLQRENGWFTLTSNGRTVIRKSWQPRAKWYSADFNDSGVYDAARRLAGEMKWPCFERWLELPEGHIPITGSGSLSLRDENLVVEGRKHIRLPDSTNVEERFDSEEFRRRLAIEAGVLPNPPEIIHSKETSEPLGLLYRKDFISEAEEDNLITFIDAGEWSEELKRRVQHYGWRYDYKRRRIDESMDLGELPKWAHKLALRLLDEGLVSDMPNQLIVNEYCGKQGIRAHIDQPNSFAEHIATISLLETWGMVFRHRGRKEKIEKPLERRSVAVMGGAARYEWTHEIPDRWNEPTMDQLGKRGKIKRNRRLSLTFRAVRNIAATV